MFKYLLIVLLFSCTREYSVEKIQSKINFDTTLTGTGNDSWYLKLPDSLVGQTASIKFYVTLYSTICDSLGRNDYLNGLGIFRLPIKKFTGNPVYKNKLTVNGQIVIPDTLKYYTTTYYIGDSLPVFRDTIRVVIN